MLSVYLSSSYFTSMFKEFACRVSTCEVTHGTGLHLDQTVSPSGHASTVAVVEVLCHWTFDLAIRWVVN